MARVVVEVSARLWPGDWRDGGRARESARWVGGVGGGWSQDRAWREIDGRATKGKRMLIVDIEANRSRDEGKGRPIHSRRSTRRTDKTGRGKYGRGGEKLLTNLAIKPPWPFRLLYVLCHDVNCHGYM